MENLGSLNFQSAEVGQTTLNCCSPVGARPVVQRNSDVMISLSYPLQLPAPAKRCRQEIAGPNIKVPVKAYEKRFLGGEKVICLSSHTTFFHVSYLFLYPLVVQ